MKLKLVMLFFTFLTISVKSQIISNYGIKLGIAISNQTWDYEDDFKMEFDSKLSFSPRIFVDIFNFPFWQLEGEFGYLRKGFKEKIPFTTPSQPDGTGEFITNNNSLDYFTISALAKFKYDLQLISPYIIIGPQFNLLINKDIQQGWEVIFDKYKSSNINFSIGVGTEFKEIITFPVILEYRYEGDIINNYELSNISIKNYSHVILLGIKI
ncbi:MAG: outer membrane beta-barrel protein [Ignavibacteriae bacterium]|nr:outer membrane beta-barrel protein [Ignavibacteriota bacterium]